MTRGGVGRIPIPSAKSEATPPRAFFIFAHGDSRSGSQPPFALDVALLVPQCRARGRLRASGVTGTKQKPSLRHFLNGGLASVLRKSNIAGSHTFHTEKSQKNPEETARVR